MFDVTQPDGPGRGSCSLSVTSVEDEEELPDGLLSSDSARLESWRDVASSVEKAGAELFTSGTAGVV